MKYQLSVVRLSLSACGNKDKEEKTLIQENDTLSLVASNDALHKVSSKR